VENDTMNRTWDTGNGGTGSSLIDTARQQVQPVIQQTQEKAGQLVGQARDQMVSQLDSQKERAAGSIGSAAQALRQTAQQLRDQHEEMFVPYLENAASYIDRFSGYLKERDIRQMMDEVEGFARREPGLFLGGAFALGFLAARFLKSSSPNVTQNDMYPMPDYAGARGQREYASSGPFTGPAHDMASMGSAARSEADYAASSSQGLADTAASGMAGIGAASAVPGGIGSSMSATSSPGMAETTSSAAADADADDEEFTSTTAGTGPAVRSSDDQ
jgi:hypothetical protein